MNRFKAVVAALVVGTLISMGTFGCNTFRGVGKDIQRGGEAVEDTAEDVQNR